MCASNIDHCKFNVMHVFPSNVKTFHHFGGFVVFSYRTSFLGIWKTKRKLFIQVWRYNKCFKRTVFVLALRVFSQFHPVDFYSADS